MTRKEPEVWHARAPFWVGLALTGLGGFVTVKAQIAAIESRQSIAPDMRNREVDQMQADIRELRTAVTARCKP